MQTKTSLASTLLFALFLTISWSYNIDQETNNLILTNADFNTAVNENEYLLVNFYALWCKYSKQLKPEWVSVSKTLRDENSQLKTAQVEAYDNKDVAQQYKIEGTPTIKFFINKQPYDYKGLNNATQILEFVNRKLKKPLTEVDDTQTIDSALSIYEWIGILVGSDAANQDIITGVAFDNSDIWFVKTGTGAVTTKYGQAQAGSFILVNNITGSFDVFTGSLSGDAVTQFIKEKKFPSVPKFSKGTAEKIFYGDDPAMILIKSSETGDQSAETAFKTASQSIGKNIFMTIASYDEEIGRLLCRQLGIEQSELPTVRIVKPGNDRVLKYYLDGSITADSINQFYQDYTNKKAKRFYLSEPIPQNNDLVTKVVGKTYDQMVNNPSQDVLLFISAPWCSHCVALYPIYDNVARKMHNVDNFLVAKIDASENDLEVFGLDVLDFPTILLFPKGGKSSPIVMEGEKDEYAFDRFIRAHATVALTNMKGPNPFKKDEL